MEMVADSMLELGALTEVMEQQVSMLLVAVVVVVMMVLMHVYFQ